MARREFAFRLLWKGKGIAATTLLTLALCIGATTAIFSTVYSLMLKPLPFDHPREIVELYTSARKAGLNHMQANVPFYLDYSQHATSYAAVGLWQYFYGMVGSEDAVTRAGCVKVTADIFGILRVQPLLGSFFTKEQNQPGADKIVVLTQSCWQQDYGENPGAIGREVRLNEESCRIVGVAPRVFEAMDARVKYIQPLSWRPDDENPQRRYGVSIALFGRLKPGITAGQADAEAKTMEKSYGDAGPAPLKQFVERSGMTMNVSGVQDQRVQPVRATLLMLQGGVAFVLLIGCVNVANLLLVRSNARQSELAIRAALGAGRGAISRQLMLESLILTGRIVLPRALRGTAEVAENTQRRLLDAMKEIPGVSSSALSTATPFQGGLGIGALTLENDPLPPGAPQPGAFIVAVTPDYLSTLGLKVLAGRFFEEADKNSKPRRFVVDASFAQKYFPGKSAIGGHFTFGNRPDKPEGWDTIIGVVKDVPHNGVEEKSGNPFIYVLIQGNQGPGAGFTLFLRTGRPAGDVITALREKLRAIDPGIVLFDTGEMTKVIDSSYDNRRAVMLLLAAFAGLALFLSALGIYGVLAYDVSQRTREIGVRGALGATREQIVGLILQQGLSRTGIGLAIGLVGAVLLSRYIKSLLFAVAPTDPLVYVGVSAVLLAVAALASYLPARRAARIDPIVALREE